MKTAMIKSLYIFCAALLMVSANSGFCADGESSPAPAFNYTLKDGFEPGMGGPLGKILMVTGNGVILHQNENTGYRVQKGLPLYKSDTIITLEKTRLRLSLNDGSIVTMAPETTLTINRSVYDPENKSRSTFLGMDVGKARFWAVKMKDFKNSEFNVKTKTAVAGVRGSDFVIAASDILTEVTTLKDTLLALTSLDNPGAAPLLLSDFERSRIPKGALPTEAERIGIDEIEEMMREFLFERERFDPDNMIETTVEREEEKGEKGESETGTAEPEKSADELFKEFSDKTGVLLPDEALVKPDMVSPGTIADEFKLIDIVKTSEITRVEDDTKDQESDFSQQKQETDVREAQAVLPAPVGSPGD